MLLRPLLSVTQSQKMNLNLPGSRRWRLHDRMRVHASRERAAAGSRRRRATQVPAQNTEVLHDFLFRLFATCMYTPECSVLAFMYVLRLLSYHPHLRVTPRNCQRLLLCSVMVAQKIHDDTPLRNVDFAVAWGRVLPGADSASVSERFRISTSRRRRLRAPRASTPSTRRVPQF
jgi:hypothetical protein